MLRWLVPHHQIGTVVELTPERLRRWQLKALLLDVDCTLKRYRAPGVSPEVAAWLQSLHEADFGLCLVSNGRARRIGELAETLRLPYVAKALKPLPFGLRRAVRKLGFPVAHTAMVGDQLFADAGAAHAPGRRTLVYADQTSAGKNLSAPGYSTAGRSRTGGPGKPDLNRHARCVRGESRFHRPSPQHAY